VGLLVAIAAVGTFVYFFLLAKPASRNAARTVAHLTAVEGSVRVKAGATGAWTPGKAGLELRTGDVVQTNPKAAAAITFLSGNVAKVRPDSVVLISEREGTVAEEATAWHVQSGHVNFDLKRSTEIVTPTARTRASAASSGNIDVSEQGATGVRIFKGEAEVSTKAGQTVTVTDNEAVLVDVQGRAGPRIPLPKAPTLVAPPTQATLPYVAPPHATAQLTWDAVGGATTYHVAMDYNLAQADLLLSTALEQSDVAGTSHELNSLDPGKYFWRVAGVTREGLEGEFSRVSIFAVVKQAEPTPVAPRLEAQATDLESVVEVKGRTDPGSQVTVDGNAAKVLPDGQFCEHVRKTGPSVVVIRATAADGQFTEQTLRVPGR